MNLIHVPSKVLTYLSLILYYTRALGVRMFWAHPHDPGFEAVI